MAKPRRKAFRVLRVLGWTLLGLVLALYIGLPVVMAVAASWPAHSQVGPPPAGFREVTLTTEDGVKLAAWYRESTNGAAVILIHGAGSSRENTRSQAVMLAEHGYGVLSLDLRGHGESGGRTNRLGWQGTRDVAAAVGFLSAQQGVTSLGALGYSMGGEVLLGASAECPEIRAIVADGATRRSTSELLALPSERSPVRNFTARVMYSAVRLFTWSGPPEPLLDEMVRSSSTSFMFIAAGDVGLEVAFNELFAKTLVDRATLWVAPDVGHIGAWSRYPDEYERRVLTFLDDRLLSDAPAP